MNGTDRLVDDYLRRLEQAAHALPPERRAELVLEIRDHIAEARTSSGASTDELWTRNLLERLGSPDEIAAAAISDGEAPAGRTPRKDGFGMLERVAMGLVIAGFAVGIPGVFDLGHSRLAAGGTDFLGLGRLVIISGVLVALFSSRWAGAAKWTLAVMSLTFLTIWTILADFPPVASVDASGRSYDDPTRWHWQVAFVIVAVLYAGTLLLLSRDLSPGQRPAARELTALLLLGLGWYVGPGAALVALAVAWRSPGMAGRGRWVATALLVPALVALLTIPLGFAERVNRRGVFDEATAWAVLLACSAVLAGWLVVRFSRPIEENA